MEHAVENLSTAIGHACYQGFSKYKYQDRDWKKYKIWRENVYDKLSKLEKMAAIELEHDTGVPMGPPDSIIIKERFHTPHDVEVFQMFSQVWSSTALGFGGIGGQAITDAYTIILRSNLTSEYCVYFSGRIAYRITLPSNKFFEDAANYQMSSIEKAKGLYERSD